MTDVWQIRLGGWRAARVVGVLYPTLDYWIRSGVLPTPTKAANGKGSRRQLGFLDLVRARTVARLRGEGISLQTIRKAIAKLGEEYRVGDPLAETANLIVAGGEVFWAPDDTILLNVLRQQLAARPLVLVAVGEVVAEIRARVEACA